MRLFVLLFVSMMLGNCAEDPRRLITVDGPVQFSGDGYILEHEHLLADFIGATDTGYHRWDRDSVILRVLPYLQNARSNGVRLLIDATPAYLGRDPLLYKKLSKLSGVQIMTNTGYYGAGNKYIPKHAYSDNAQQLADRWIDEFNNGIENTGVRPGFIKIAVDRKSVLSEIHNKLVEAAAITHIKTGLTIASHTIGDSAALAQLDILDKYRVAPDAFIWIHAQNGSDEIRQKLAAKGVWISIDNVEDSRGRLQKAHNIIMNFKDAGMLDRVLISHDGGWYRVGEPGGGHFSDFSDIFSKLIPMLMDSGLTKDDIDLLLKTNPVKAYSVKIRKKGGNTAL